MIRVFIAIELPASVSQAISDLQGRLRSRLADEGAGRAVRWVGPDGIHLTLKFIGEVDEDEVPDISLGLREAVDGVPPFELEPSGVGCFPNLRAPRVVWVGLGAMPDALFTLASRVEERMFSLGFPKERREFKPHLTLGRVGNRVGKAEQGAIGRVVREVGSPVFRPFQVSTASLMQSELRREGASYTRLVEFRLVTSAGT